MTNSLDELFVRVEKFLTDPSREEILDWLSGKGTDRTLKRSSFGNVANILAEPFEIRKRAEETEDLDELKELLKEAKRTEVKETETQKFVLDRIEIKKAELKIAVEISKEFERGIFEQFREEVNVENWKNIGRVETIRESNGRLITWRKV